MLVSPISLQTKFGGTTYRKSFFTRNDYCFLDNAPEPIPKKIKPIFEAGTENPEINTLLSEIEREKTKEYLRDAQENLNKQYGVSNYQNVYYSKNKLLPPLNKDINVYLKRIYDITNSGKTIADTKKLQDDMRTTLSIDTKGKRFEEYSPSNKPSPVLPFEDRSPDDPSLPSNQEIPQKRGRGRPPKDENAGTIGTADTIGTTSTTGTSTKKKKKRNNK